MVTQEIANLSNLLGCLRSNRGVRAKNNRKEEKE